MPDNVESCAPCAVKPSKEKLGPMLHASNFSLDGLTAQGAQDSTLSGIYPKMLYPVRLVRLNHPRRSSTHEALGPRTRTFIATYPDIRLCAGPRRRRLQGLNSHPTYAGQHHLDLRA